MKIQTNKFIFIILIVIAFSLNAYSNSAYFPMQSYGQLCNVKEWDFELSYNTINSLFFIYDNDDPDDRVSEPIFNFRISYGLSKWFTLNVSPYFFTYRNDSGRDNKYGCMINGIFRYNPRLYSFLRVYISKDENAISIWGLFEGLNLGWAIIDNQYLSIISELYLGLFLFGEFTLSLGCELKINKHLSVNTFYRYSTVYVYTVDSQGPNNQYQFYGITVNIKKIIAGLTFSSGFQFNTKEEYGYKRSAKIIFAIQKDIL
ncbi:hypothetical protein J7L48_10450 [bacterium]|nr:hypothetical protein [bacterium]